MNILIIAPYIPYPLSEGGRISQYAVIDCLRKMHKLMLILVSNSIEDDKNINELKSLWPDVQIIPVITYTKQEEYGNGKKISNSILKFLKLTKNTFKKLLLNASSNNSNEIDLYFTNIISLKSAILIRSIIQIVNKIQVDIIQIDLIEYADIAYVLPAHVKKVFVHHEIRFARILTSFKTEHERLDAYNKYIIAFVKEKERMLLKLYDAIFVFSEDDKLKLLHEIPDTDIYVTPFPVLDNNFIQITENNANINKLVFVGGEEHKPNKDAVEWYIDEILPYVIKTSKLRLHVVGVWTKETIIKYKSNTSIVFEGFVEDLVAFCQNSIMVAPVRIGSGIRTKILYAMAQGIPIVSATIGCEGIGAINGEQLLIADDAELFAEAINTLITNKSLVLKLIKNGQTLIKSKYSQEAVCELRSKYFNEIVSETKKDKSFTIGLN